MKALGSELLFTQQRKQTVSERWTLSLMAVKLGFHELCVLTEVTSWFISVGAGISTFLYVKILALIS